MKRTVDQTVTDVQPVRFRVMMTTEEVVETSVESLSPTVLFRTTFTRTITLDELLKLFINGFHMTSDEFPHLVI